MGKDNPIFILVIVLILVGYAFWTTKKENSALGPVQNTSPIVDPTKNTNNGSNVYTGVAPVTTLSYGDALVKYKDARIQLNQNCQATPTNVTYKNNSYLMIDNRASVSRTVKVGSTFPVKAYSFKIVKLSSTVLPVTWYVDCDKSQNVATILIQK